MHLNYELEKLLVTVVTCNMMVNSILDLSPKGQIPSSRSNTANQLCALLSKDTEIDKEARFLRESKL